MPTMAQGIDKALANFSMSQELPLPRNIPLEPAEFYHDFGYFRHPKTRQPVTELAPYQLKVWRSLHASKRVLVVKSHKVGLSTSQMLADFQLSILPSSNPLSSRGFDTLLISQTKELAKELLRNLRRMILKSDKYSAFLIDKPTEIEEYGNISYKAIMRDEQTKTSVIYIRNNEDETRPSRIIALGADNPGSIESWPNIHHVHMSDVVATIGDYSDSLNVAITRLANTNGTIIIETIPDFNGSPLHMMFDNPGDFIPIKITAEEGVAAKVIDPEFLESERQRLGPLYPQLYGADFLQAGNAWYDTELFQYEEDNLWEVTTS